MVGPTSPEAFEAALARLRAEIPNPRSGVFGPASEVWQRNREALVFLGSGRAALLQLAHPVVAYGVSEHSVTRKDRLARFRKTFYYVFAMIFGDLDAATEMARAVFAMHRRVRGTIDEDVGPYRRGTPYSANDPEAQLWVAATLFDTSARLYEAVVGPLSPLERRRWTEEFRRFLLLFGVPEALAFPSFEAFQAYNERMWSSDVLSISRPALELKDILLRPPHPTLAPLWRWYAIVTAGLLPDRIRHGYGLALSSREAWLYRRSIDAARAAYPLVPDPLRILPVYRRAVARLEEREVGAVEAQIERLVFGRLAKVTSGAVKATR